MTITPFLLAAALLAPAQDEQPPPQSPPPALDLSVLYVGSADGPRTASFVEFLRANVREVGTAVYPTFEESQADGYDVVVLDVEMHPTERSIGIGKPPVLSPSYSRATILVNGPGVIAVRPLETKIDWW